MDANGNDAQKAKREEIKDRLLLKWLAYSQLFQGADGLLDDGTLFWTERLLLRLVRALSGRRLEQLNAVLPVERPLINEAQVKEALLDAAAEAALGGHELGEWTAVEDGWQATCLRCGRTTWVGETGVRYSLLDDSCSQFGETRG